MKRRLTRKGAVEGAVSKRTNGEKMGKECHRHFDLDDGRNERKIAEELL